MYIPLAGLDSRRAAEGTILGVEQGVRVALPIGRNAAFDDVRSLADNIEFVRIGSAEVRRWAVSSYISSFDSVSRSPLSYVSRGSVRNMRPNRAPLILDELTFMKTSYKAM